MASRVNPANTSQQHGLDIENLVRISWMFSQGAAVARNGLDSFDIDGSCDPNFGFATSVKTAGGDWIGLADAERFCQIDRPYRMVFAPWVQETPRIKSYPVLHEVIIPISVMRAVIGDLTPEMVLAWHKDIASFASGPEGAKAARERAREIRAEIRGRHGILRLDFKIDDRDQRRLQFSLRFSRLLELLKGRPDYVAYGVSQPLHVIHDKEFHQYPLPIRLISTRRVIQREAVVEEREPDAPIMFDDAPIVVAADPVDDVLGSPLPPPCLRRPTPIRREERDRKRRAVADIRQIPLFG